ncbi:uncharacterized protein LOC142635434 [Castanea sativa]|uniref:uncharacterized protein LOC142635434 n=1 Tax=Castanea sativa TaxID=21020 RepID=UPI003F64F86A
MRLRRDQLQPVNSPLVGFRGMKVQRVGTITLPVVVGAYPQQITKEVNFLVVDCSSSYNAIIGKPTLNCWKAVTSTYYLSVKFPTEHRVGQVQGDQLAAIECYLAMLAMDEHVQTMSIDKRRITAEPTEALEDVPLDESNLEKSTRIGASMEKETKYTLVQLLKKSLDVFTWSHEDMPDNAIKEEVQKLITGEFIREVYYSDWLANVVMVKKANGKWWMCVDFTDLNKACPKDSYPLPRID